VAAALLAVAGLGLEAVVLEPDRLVVRRTDVALPSCPAALEGLRIAALSDIHAGAPHVNAAKLRLLVERTNAERPDLVVLLGDYVIKGVPGGRFMAAEATARELAALRAPLGAVAVLGNHDWWYDGPRVRKALVGAGFRVLDNEAVALERGGRRFWVAGIGDLWTGSPDPERALATVPDGEPVLALTHNPDIFPEVPARVALTLAGHTHGGQVRLPLLGAPIVPSRFGQRYAEGLVEEQGRRIFVTPGIGTSIVPVRLGVPPEISVVVLSRATSPPPR
jgi:uncharacterized protein